MVETKSGRHRGIESLSIRNDILALTFLPSIGAKLVSLQLRASGREFMWQDPPGRLKFPPYGAQMPEYDIGGFQECFPTILETYYPEYPWRGILVPDHGEVWALPWNVEQHESGLHFWVESVCFAYRFDKWIELRDGGVIEIRYEATNPTPYDFRCIWSAHPALALKPDMRMLLPDGTELRLEFSHNGRLGGMGAIHRWPVVRDIHGKEDDLSIVKTINAGTHDKFTSSFLPEGWCAVYDPQQGDYLGYSFPLLEIPYVGFWLIQGGWPVTGKPYLVGGFEPCTGYPGDLSSAIAWGDAMTLPAQSSRTWRLYLHIGTGLKAGELKEALSHHSSFL